MKKPIKKKVTPKVAAKVSAATKKAAKKAVVAVRKKVAELVPAPSPLETALAEVAPAASKLLTMAQAFTITDAATALAANEMLVQLKTIDTAIEAKRKSLTKPLKDEAKRIEAQFRPSADAIEKANLLLREKMLAYRQSEESKLAEERKALLAKAEEAEKAGDSNAALALAQQAMSVETLDTKAAAADGSVSVRMVWDFEVEDLAKVPPEYFVLDEGRVKAAVRSGVRDIPGIRIFQKEQLAVSGAVAPSAAA